MSWTLILFFTLGSHAFANVIRIENTRPGFENWGLSKPSLNREIDGYAGKTSINVGESLNFHISSQTGHFTYEVFRLGWYQGLGARRILGPIYTKGASQPMPTPDPVTGLVECRWPISFSVTTSSDGSWITGVYLVRLTNVDGFQSFIPFVVRDDGRKVDLLIQQSITTDVAKH